MPFCILYMGIKVLKTKPKYIALLLITNWKEGIKLAEESLIELLQGKKYLGIPDKTPRERIKIWEDTEIVEIEVTMELNKDILKKEWNREVIWKY